MIATREITDKEFELVVLMYVQEEPRMYPLSKAQELFDQDLFESDGRFGLVEKGASFRKGDTIYGVGLSQKGIDFVAQADPVKVARIWLDHDFIIAGTGWILTKMSRDQLPEFLSHESLEVRKAALTRLRRLGAKSKR